MSIWKILHSSLLCTGTAVGAGFIALPMFVVNLGIPMSIGLIFLMCFVAYKSSMMLVDLNCVNRVPASIVGLTKKYTGNACFLATLFSFYLFSFGVLTVYFSCFSDTLTVMSSINPNVIGIGFACALFILLSLHIDKMSKINSLLVLVSLIMLSLAVFFLQSTPESRTQTISMNWKELGMFFPICLTSFVMQGVCPQICSYLNYNRRHIQIALIIGLLIPMGVYMTWITGVLNAVSTHDSDFFVRMQQHQVTVGQLIDCLCKTSGSLFGVILKWVTLCAVVTSAIGFAVCVVQAMRAIVPLPVARIIPCIAPVAVNWLIPNAFVCVLCFSGLMAMIFTILSPYLCLKRKKLPCYFSYYLCVVIALVVGVCEIVNLLHDFL